MAAPHPDQAEAQQRATSHWDFLESLYLNHHENFNEYNYPLQCFHRVRVREGGPLKKKIMVSANPRKEPDSFLGKETQSKSLFMISDFILQPWPDFGLCGG